MARRNVGRHGRRVQKITPRRWLPFLALVAVVAGAVVISRQNDQPDPVRGRAPAAATRLPVASQADALSTAWYCAGGSGLGPDGPAELSVVIANAEDHGVTSDISIVGANGKQATTTVEVPANGRARVVGSEFVKATWLAMSVEVLGGRATVEREVQGPLGFDVSPCSSNAATTWFVPSGSTVRGARLDLVLYNPFPDATSVDIVFATDQGTRSPRALKGFAIPGRSVRVVPQQDLPARRPEIATKVTARTGRLVVDRVQTYDGTGDTVKGTGADPVTTPAPKGLASTAAIPTVGPRWIFPDARVSDGVRTQVAIYNPSTREARIDVAVDHQTPDRYPEVEPVQITVPPRSEQTVDLTQVQAITPDVPFSIDVRSLDEVPVVAEQLSFGAAPVSPATTSGATKKTGAPAIVQGFAAVPGAPVAATTWFFASRGGGVARNASVVVANPSAATVHLTVTQLSAGKRSVVAGASVSIAAGDRRALDLRTADVGSAIIIESDGGVVASHTMVGLHGRGLAEALGTPFPETVQPLLPPR